MGSYNIHCIIRIPKYINQTDIHLTICLLKKLHFRRLSSIIYAII